MRSSLPRRCRALRVFLLALTAFGLVAGPAAATWSIVVVNHKTGEVACASATCLNGSLSDLVGVVVPGKGAAAAQATISTFTTKKMLRNAIDDGLAPKIIMSALANNVSSHNKQYGVATFSGPPQSWHGSNVCLGHPDVTGTVGDISYAIQGNILTGGKVVFEAEKALIETDGDLGQRLMAAMEAARLMGGDGRCSCEETFICNGNACGAPPPNFDPNDPATGTSACIGFVFIGRVGDENPTCSQQGGCATGDYYLRIEHTTTTCDIDPVVALHAQYADWRAAQQGRPDHVLSEVAARGTPLVGDGVTQARVDIALRDIEGNPVTHGGHSFALDVEGERPPRTELADLIDHGDGTYTLLLTSTKPGSEALEIECDDHVGLQVTFYPRLDVEILAPGSVASGPGAASAREGWETLPFTVHGGAAAAGQGFAVFAGVDGLELAPELIASGLLDEHGEFRGALEVPAGTAPAWTVVRLAGDGQRTLTRS